MQKNQPANRRAGVLKSISGPFVDLDIFHAWRAAAVNGADPRSIYNESQQYDAHAAAASEAE